MTNTSTARPEFGGECAFAVSLGKGGVAGQVDCHLERDGKHYVFSNPVAKLLWRLIPGRQQASEREWSRR